MLVRSPDLTVQPRMLIEYGYEAVTVTSLPGTVQFVLADGSVRGFNQNLDSVTYWALGTRGGGELVKLD